MAIKECSSEKSIMSWFELMHGLLLTFLFCSCSGLPTNPPDDDDADQSHLLRQIGYLKASNAEANDWLGSSVAISGHTLVIGAEQEASSQTTITNGSGASEDNSAENSGAAYVFVNDETGWNQQAYLKAPNAQEGDSFGRAVAISADTILVGAEREDSSQTTVTNGATASADNSAGSAGSAYLFSP